RVVRSEGSGSSSGRVVRSEGSGSSSGRVVNKEILTTLPEEDPEPSLLTTLPEERFIGNSQNGIHSLESRVQGLEMALDELCHDLSVCGRVPNSDPTVHCCKIPGAQFLRSKLWRRAEGRDSSKFSNSSSLSTVKVQNSNDKDGGDFLKGGKQTFGHRGGFVINPLAEVNSQSRGSSGASPKGMRKSIMHDNESQHAQGSSRKGGTPTVTHAIGNQTFTGKLRLGVAAGTPLGWR
ncbi:hypothetical protein Taro_046718, partial [Colocasia esculenta]|nr:hypothetical protein [Colocasia esculenta]